MKFFNILFTLLKLLSKLALALLIGLIFYIATPIKTTQTVTIPKGSVTKIIEHLKDEGYALSIIDRYILVMLGQPKSGTLTIGEESMNRIDFLKKLTNAKEAINIVTLIPGETTPIFLEKLAKERGFNLELLKKSYQELSPYKEAGVVPDTYHISKDATEKELLQTLIEQSNRKYKKLSKDKSKKEWLKILTVASIVQKEAANTKEMPIVASVIYNRLKKDMPLQMDGTLNYGKYSHVKVTPERIKNDKSKFNTYLNKGLPPYPICSVSIDAIESALNPKETKYLYFMRNKSGVHDFTASYREHLKNIKRAR